MRIAMIGLDSSRPLRVARHLRAREADEGHRLTALVHEGDALPDGLRELARGAAVVRDAEEIGDRVDVVIDLGRRAASRVERLEPLLRRGIHCFVDKPLALTRADAARLIDAARSGRAALVSDSGYRLAVAGRTVGRGAAIEVAGPADRLSPWGGLAFYGIHHAQILHELGRMPRLDLLEVDDAGDDLIIARSDGPAPSAIARFDAGADGFSLSVDGVARPLSPPSDYLERLLDDFLRDCAAPRRDEAWEDRLVGPVAFIERVRERLDGR